MKKKFITGGLVLALTLVGCQAADDNDGATGTTGNNNNVEPTRFHETRTGDGTTTRDYTLQRDADRFQNREGNNIGRTRDNNTNQINTRNINQVNDNDNENRYEVGEEAANRITDKMEEIESAYVLTTENNAYVAAELDADNNNGNNRRNDNDTFDDELSDDVKEQISDIVKSVDRDIDNVYVSTNPDFFNLTNNYVEDVDRGDPVEGFFDQFSNMIERVFPQNK